MTEVRRNDETIFGVLEMLGESFAVCFFFPCRDASNHNWHNFDLTEPASALNHLVGVGKVHLDRVLFFVDVDAHPLEEVCAMERFEGFSIEWEVAEWSLVGLTGRESAGIEINVMRRTNYKDALSAGGDVR